MIVQIIALGPKMTLPQGLHILHRLKKGKPLKIFLSETRRPRSLIIGMQLHLVDLYQGCSNYSPWVKNGPALGVTCFIESGSFRPWVVSPGCFALSRFALN